MAFDAASGELSDFAPVLDGRVYALTATHVASYVGGDFRTVDGVKRRALVKLDLPTGAVDTGFDAALSGGKVNDLEVLGSRLLVGGTATKRLAALDLDLDPGADTAYLDLGIRGKIEGSWGTGSRPTQPGRNWPLSATSPRCRGSCGTGPSSSTSERRPRP